MHSRPSRLRTARSRGAFGLLLAAGVLAGGLAAPAQAADSSAHDKNESRYVEYAWWSEEENGARLHVLPTEWGREATLRTPHKAFAEALDIAGWRSYDDTVYLALTNQYRCHADRYLDKKSWNVETWRPFVGYESTVDAFCNPE